MPTKIEWAEESWNPVTGCTKKSEGCLNCYAERMAIRLAGRCGYDADNPFAVTLHPDRLEQPLHWRKPRRVFVCSMGDLFHDDVPFECVDRVFAVMACAWWHTFMVLTKRPARMYDYLKHYAAGGRHVWQAGQQIAMPNKMAKPDPGWPLPNVWIGVTAESQLRANIRLSWLSKTPAAMRFVSVEPMLGPIDISRWMPWLDLVICGGETGPGWRNMEALWAVDLLAQCQAAGVPFFFKNMAGRRETPPALRVRELPMGEQ